MIQAEPLIRPRLGLTTFRPVVTGEHGLPVLDSPCIPPHAEGAASRAIRLPPNATHCLNRGLLAWHAGVCAPAVTEVGKGR